MYIKIKIKTTKSKFPRNFKNLGDREIYKNLSSLGSSRFLKIWETVKKPALAES
jgi:hypothetical protein